MESIVVAFVIAVGCRLGGLVLNNLVTAKAAYLPFMYLLPLSAMLLSWIVIKGADKNRSGLALVDRVVEALVPMTRAARDLIRRIRPKAAAP